MTPREPLRIGPIEVSPRLLLAPMSGVTDSAFRRVVRRASGCPVPKVVKRGGGCELMRQPDKLYAILRAVKREVSIPVTLKMRSGWDEGSLNAADIAEVAQAAGLAMVTIHG